MQLNQLKMTLAGVWVLVACVLGLAAGVTTVGGWILLASAGLLPPVAMFLLWNHPPESISESIRDARR